MLNKEEIKKIIPYKEPFLFIDEISEVGRNFISGSYQTSEEDCYFKGHFVDFKIMPGVLVVEALAQLSTVLLRKNFEKICSSLGSAGSTANEKHEKYHFLAYDVKSCQFLKPIFPGDKITLNAEILAIYSLPETKTKIARVKAWAQVEKELKTEARFSIVIIGKKEFNEKYKK